VAFLFAEGVMNLATNQRVWTRQFLRDQGYRDDDIQFDQNRNMVTLQGRDFFSATPEQDGNTYGSLGDLQNALTRYRQNQRASSIEQLTNALMQRAQAEAPRFTAPEPFSYNPQADPQYQNALAEAQRVAGISTNNALVNLGRRGIGNSQSAVTAAQANAQAATRDVTTRLLPQLIQQAYQRYVDQANRDYQMQLANYNAMQDQYRNLSSLVPLLSGLTQQELDNQYRSDALSEQQRQNRINLAQWLTNTYGVYAEPKLETQVAFDQVSGLTPLNRQQFDTAQRQNELSNAWRTIMELGYVPENLASVVGLPAGTRTQQAIAQQQQLANAAADNRRADAQLDLQRQRFEFEREQAQNRSKEPSTNEIMSEVISELDRMTNEQRRRFFEGERAALIRDLGINGYNQLYRQYFDEYGDPIR
jgi:hypothetical protein